MPKKGKKRLTQPKGTNARGDKRKAVNAVEFVEPPQRNDDMIADDNAPIVNVFPVTPCEQPVVNNRRRRNSQISMAESQRNDNLSNKRRRTTTSTQTSVGSRNSIISDLHPVSGQALHAVNANTICSLGTTGTKSGPEPVNNHATTSSLSAIKRRPSLSDSSDEEIVTVRNEIIVEALINNRIPPFVNMNDVAGPSTSAQIPLPAAIDIEPAAVTIHAPIRIQRRPSLDDSSEDEINPIRPQKIVVQAIVNDAPDLHDDVPLSQREVDLVVIQAVSQARQSPPIPPIGPANNQANWDEIQIDIPGEPLAPVVLPPVLPPLPVPIINPVPIIINDGIDNNNIDIAEEIQILVNYEELEQRRRQLPHLLRATGRVLPADHPTAELGLLHRICRHCQARHFACEMNTRRQFATCCRVGKVDLPALTPMPDLLRSLYHGQHPLSNHFMQHVLPYNYAFQFASLQAELRDLPQRRQAPPVYCIKGKIYHRLSNLNMNAPNPNYGHLYFLTPGEAVDQRNENNRIVNERHNQRVNERHNGRVNERHNRNNERNAVSVLRVQLIRSIENLLRQINPYALAYMHLREVYNQELENIEQMRINNAQNNIPPPLDTPRIVLELLRVRGRDNRRYDLPILDEVAAVYRFNPDMPPTSNLRVYLRDGPDAHYDVFHTNGLVQPLTFPLLFPYGESGWNCELQHVGGNHRLTQCDYYGFRLAIRDGDDRFRYAGKLGQQYIVNAYVLIETNRLVWTRKNQDKLRAEQYVGLADYVHRRNRILQEQQQVPVDEIVDIGRMFILPTSYAGSPRYQQQAFQDAMSVVCRFGPPSIFITLTANPNWQEMTENIPRGQQANNHPMLMSRVFKNKSDILLADICQSHIFGRCIANLAVIEFQKRGLPHMHDLIIMDNQDRVHDAQNVDQLVSAEIPDRETEPELYELVCRHMVHNPCSELTDDEAKCKVDGVCTKGFPKDFAQHTVLTGNGRIIYRRRDDGRTVTTTHNNVRYELDNRWIVPYNPYCLLKYKCHMNIECCAGTNTVKYLYKYLFKGTDNALVRVALEFREYDEIESFVNARYMSPPEASWHILKYSTIMNTHTIYRLPVHLPNLQAVRFQPGFEVVALERNETTHLTEWFRLNQTDIDARQYLYIEIPTHYVWQQRPIKCWARRRRGGQRVITRMYGINMRNQELFCLRTLLLHVRGATSFADVRTVDGRVYDTFLEACRQRNLMADDTEWRRALDEACQRQMPRQLRSMFAYMLLFCEITDKLALWNHYRLHFIEDFTRRGIPEDDAVQRALGYIQYILRLHGTNLLNFGLPEPQVVQANVDDDDDDNRNVPVNAAAERIAGDDMRRQLNPEQSVIFDAVWTAIHNDDEPNRLFFLNAAAGAGKSFVFQTLITCLRGENCVYVAAAPTGIAASLLTDGRTLHSRFKLPLVINETTTSSVTPTSEDGRLIASAKLIVIDEISMVTRQIFNIVERTLRDLCNDVRPFANKVVLVGGDFRQTLPVVKNNLRDEIVGECVKGRLHSFNFRRYNLLTNVRALQGQREFCEWLLQLGDGTLPAFRRSDYGNLIEIPNQCLVASKRQLLDFCLGDLSFDFISNKALLTPLNVTCHEINDDVIDRLAGRPTTYLSADSIEIMDDPVLEFANIAVEFLNSLCPSGFPPHRLVLKVGAIVVLLRNLNLKKGLCNGTRLLIRVLGNSYLDAEKMDTNGRLTGERVFIPRIDLISTDDTLPFNLKRRQFPVRLGYCMTINKSQGQTFEQVGIYLPTPVFAHGQLYVAFSRTRGFDRVKIFIEDTPLQGTLREHHDNVYTRNVVYREVL